MNELIDSTELLPLRNQQFWRRFIYHWVTTVILLICAAWLPFIFLDISSIRPNSWKSGIQFPGIIALFGIPPILIASIVIALLHTREDRKKKYPKTYWYIWLIPASSLIGICCFSYFYYVHTIFKKDQQLRYKLEQEVKNNNHPNYSLLADMYMNGWGGNKDIGKANQFYQKACDSSNNGTNIEACKKAKDYKKLRILLPNSNNPYDMATLAIIYENGLGGEKDYAKAKEFYQKACPTGQDFICTTYNPFQ